MKITPINGNTETEGSPCLYRGVELMVARSNNTEFQKVFRQRMKPYQDELDNGRMDNDQSKKIMIECVARAILVDWKTFTDTDGNECEYSVENAVELLTDDNDCYDAVIKHSENVENYLVGEREALKVK